MRNSNAELESRIRLELATGNDERQQIRGIVLRLPSSVFSNSHSAFAPTRFPWPLYANFC